jgi:hypothetical protein
MDEKTADEVEKIISAGAADDEERIDYTKMRTSQELAEGTCTTGKPHRVFIGYTGDMWPAFCVDCRCFAVETKAFPDSDEDW